MTDSRSLHWQHFASEVETNVMLLRNKEPGNSRTPCNCSKDVFRDARGHAAQSIAVTLLIAAVLMGVADVEGSSQQKV